MTGAQSHVYSRGPQEVGGHRGRRKHPGSLWEAPSTPPGLRGLNEKGMWLGFQPSTHLRIPPSHSPISSSSAFFIPMPQPTWSPSAPRPFWSLHFGSCRLQSRPPPPAAHPHRDARCLPTPAPSGDLRGPLPYSSRRQIFLDAPCCLCRVLGAGETTDLKQSLPHGTPEKRR